MVSKDTIKSKCQAAKKKKYVTSTKKGFMSKLLKNYHKSVRKKTTQVKNLQET